MPTALVHLMDAWSSIYGNSASLRTLVGFAHVGALVTGGGAAIVADRATLVAGRADAAGRARHLAEFQRTHRLVVLSLGVLLISGVLLLAADFETYVGSRVFWTKMALIGALFVNGALLVRAGHAADHGSPVAWSRLRRGAIASLALWTLTTLLGAALPNI
ncbi:MAG: hypothetical protein R2752_05460 [Vicinamibacterales bacterium]